MKRLLLSFLTCASAYGAATDVVIPQRDGSNRNQFITITGSSNTWEVLGFNGSGVLGPLTITDLLTNGSPAITSAMITDGTIAAVDLASNSVTSAKVLDGELVNADISASAAIALSKLATDPLARANHTGTQTLSTISDAGTLAALSAVASAQITDGTIVNADINASAAIATTKLDIRVGTTYAAQINAPITTSPYAPTWTSETFVLPYGATGEIDLPAVAAYTRAVLLIYCTGTFTITVDPNGSEVIFENGASLGAGTADVISGTAGMTVAYVCDSGRWFKMEGGGGGTGSGFPLTADADLAGYNLLNGGDIAADSINAVTLSGDGSGITDLNAAELTGTVPDLTFGKITTADAMLKTQTAGAGNVVVTTNAATTITLDATTETITFDALPPTGTSFEVILEGHSADCTVTWPSTYCFGIGGLRTSFVAPANKPTSILVRRDATRYVMWGAPTNIGDLPADTTPAISAKVEIDQGSGGEHSTLAQIRDLLGVDFNGTAATPNADATVAVSFDALTFYHFSGATQELDLPAAAGYVGRGVVIEWGGTYTVTVDPNGSEVLSYNGTEAAAGEALVLSGTVGEVLVFKSDGTNWSVASNGPATIAEETP